MRFLFTRESATGLLLYVTLFFLAFRIIPVGVALTLLSILALLLIGVKITRELIAIFGVSFYILFVLFGYDNYEYNIIKFISLSVIFCSTNLLFFYIGEKKADGIKLMIFYSWSSFLYASSISLYSLAEGYQGYASLYDFYSSREVNSPQYAMLMFISSVFICEFSRMKVLGKIFILISSFLLSSVYLSSRAALLLFSLYFLLSIYRWGGFRVIILLVILIFTSYSFIDYLLLDSELYIVERLLYRGLDSPRFALNIYGFNHLFEYPFGGLKAIDAGAEYTGNWFHNVYLDLVRISGYLLMLLWASFQVFIFFGVVYYFTINKKLGSSFFIVFFMISIIYLQDLSFDGFYNIMGYLLFVFGSTNLFFNMRKSNGLD